METENVYYLLCSRNQEDCVPTACGAFQALPDYTLPMLD